MSLANPVDGESAAVIEALCVSLFQGRILQAIGFDGRAYTAGPYSPAVGEKMFVMMSWPGGLEETSGDAFDVATAFYAQCDVSPVLDDEDSP